MTCRRQEYLVYQKLENWVDSLSSTISLSCKDKFNLYKELIIIIVEIEITVEMIYYFPVIRYCTDGRRTLSYSVDLLNWKQEGMSKLDILFVICIYFLYCSMHLWKVDRVIRLLECATKLSAISIKLTA